MILKQYYRCIKFFNKSAQTDYWYTNNFKPLLQCYDLVLPLGHRRPRNIKKEQIKT